MTNMWGKYFLIISYIILLIQIQRGEISGTGIADIYDLGFPVLVLVLKWNSGPQ